MFLRNLLLSLGLSSLVIAAPVYTDYTTDLPTVDLGYAIHRASYYNESYDAYVFSNIRFAAPPTGALRFGAPQPPLQQNRSKINDGSEGFICPQALPVSIPAPKSPEPASEDCLFLDVIVPRRVLNGDFGEVPVLFWIFGGGYYLGSKTFSGDPINFLKDSPSPVVYVAPSYRLGYFGWLAGPSFTLSSGTTPNAGLYDQRFALQWVQKNIHLFHGQKDEVTVMGASSGAGSIMHHITAFGGEGESFFKRAVQMGPAYFLTGSHSVSENIFKEFEAAAGCTGKGIDCIREISMDDMIKLNGDIIGAVQAPRTGPVAVIDGNMVPDAPAYLFAQGRFHKNITILVSDDINEGSIFINPNSTLSQSLIDLFPGIADTVRGEFLDFYPPASNSTPYTNEIGRMTKAFGDVIFNCNRYAISAALPDSTYNVVSSIQPGTHGVFPTLLFNDLPGSDAVISAQIHHEQRRFIMNFVVSGNPNEASGQGVSQGVVWPTYGSQGLGLSLNRLDMKVVDATEGKATCEWFTKALMIS